MDFGKSPGKFHLIQAMRGLAATLVVVSHTLGSLIKHGTMPKGEQDAFWYLGNIGVSAFFVISGFIMVVTSARSFGDGSAAWIFVKKRLIRIVPAYWVATAIA